MKLIWAGCIFGAGYVLGRPEGRAKLAELLQRPEVTQLKQQATSTAATAVKTSRQQLSTATQKIKDNAVQKRAGTSTDAAAAASAAVTDTGSRRRLRLPQFARQGVRSDGSVVPVAGPVATATQTATPDTSASSTPISQASASPPGEDA
jgi:hypothetical protein